MGPDLSSDCVMLCMAADVLTLALCVFLTEGAGSSLSLFIAAIGVSLK